MKLFSRYAVITLSLIAYTLALDRELEASERGVIIVATGELDYFFAEGLKLAQKIAQQGMPVSLFTIERHAQDLNAPDGVNVVTIPERDLDYFDPSRTNDSVRHLELGRFGGKLFAMQNSPYNFTLFLDIDTMPCFNINRIFNAAENLMEYHDVAAYRFPCHHSEMCSVYINSGVIFFKNTERVKVFTHMLGEDYRAQVIHRLETFPGCPDPGTPSDCMKKYLVSHQTSWLNVDSKWHVPVLGLSQAWNCKILRGGDEEFRRLFPECCTIGAEIMYGESCIIDHKCAYNPRGTYRAIDHDHI